VEEDIVADPRSEVFLNLTLLSFEEEVGESAELSSEEDIEDDDDDEGEPKGSFGRLDSSFFRLMNFSGGLRCFMMSESLLN
jgi:hypothetical protein